MCKLRKIQGCDIEVNYVSPLPKEETLRKETALIDILIHNAIKINRNKKLKMSTKSYLEIKI